MIEGLTSPLGLGIGLGLLLGKPVGIMLSAFICYKLRIGQLPEGSNFKHILGIDFLAGIGFTMSIFISNLSFNDPIFINDAKLAVLGSSLLAGVIGFVILRSLRR